MILTALTCHWDIYSLETGTYCAGNPQNLQPIFNLAELLVSLWATQLVKKGYVASQTVNLNSLYDQVCKAQSTDPMCVCIWDSTANGPKRTKFSLFDEGMVVQNNVYFVPDDSALHQDICKLYHDHPLSGHFGVDKTTHAIQWVFWWHNMKLYIHKYI
jgi:hypothetical protein